MILIITYFKIKTSCFIRKEGILSINYYNQGLLELIYTYENGNYIAKQN